MELGLGPGAYCGVGCLLVRLLGRGSEAGAEREGLGALVPRGADGGCGGARGGLQASVRELIWYRMR